MIVTVTLDRTVEELPDEDRMAITQMIRYLGHTLDFIEVAKASHGRYQELLKLLRDRPE